jgi:hypothetical protein
MAMKDVGAFGCRELANQSSCRDVGEPEIPAHSDRFEAEREARPQGFQPAGCQPVPGRRVADDADEMAAVRLSPGQIPHVPEEAADRCPEAMDDAKLPIAHRLARSRQKNLS